MIASVFRMADPPCGSEPVGGPSRAGVAGRLPVPGRAGLRRAVGRTRRDRWAGRDPARRRAGRHPSPPSRPDRCPTPATHRAAGPPTPKRAQRAPGRRPQRRRVLRRRPLPGRPGLGPSLHRRLPGRRVGSKSSPTARSSASTPPGTTRPEDHGAFATPNGRRRKPKPPSQGDHVAGLPAHHRQASTATTEPPTGGAVNEPPARGACPAPIRVSRSEESARLPARSADDPH